MHPPDPDRLERAYRIARDALLAERTPGGYWVGELSTSALSTAVASSALALVQKACGSREYDSLIAGGARWLAENQNADGGWGDTVRSFSNISTTVLCRAAFHLTGTADEHAEALGRAEGWLYERYGKTPEELAEAVRARYGTDRTFSVPILMTSALAGLVEWREVPALPFELACFPQSWFRFLGLPVVSYALPALIAIGQTVFHHRRPGNPITRLVRRKAIPRSLAVLDRLQPPNGGFLEAAPLTSFVTLGLVSSGKVAHPVVHRAVRFLLDSVRADGSWPIDTNLSTWVTTLSVNALAAAGDLAGLDKLPELAGWLIDQQYRDRHPYTGAEPGGWAWTPLPGGVPDADDTPGAILALGNLRRCLGDSLDVQEDWQPEEEARDWLLGLQNRDGGWPTFCRGWGKLPFDRSGTDLTAHALRALAAVERESLAGASGLDSSAGVTNQARSASEVGSAFRRALDYLAREQRPDGSWVPLWFGNQHVAEEENPTYGTARVLAAYRDLDIMSSEPARRGVAWLVRAQNPDGGWGGGPGAPSSVEETALAVEALLDSDAALAVNRGLDWLVQQVEAGALAHPTPIGFYFAKLWYFERLYPIAFTVSALGRARRKLSPALTHPETAYPERG